MFTHAYHRKCSLPSGTDRPELPLEYARHDQYLEANKSYHPYAKNPMIIPYLGTPNDSAGTATDEVGRWDDCPSSCDLIGRGHSLAESGRGNGLGRSENKRPDTGRS
ncbi:hypothetical protein TNCV_4022661 [Trichonephila clavipes]|nr:hypothetical protein TNCV_4022661 [Trichonephila clavipes]